MDFMDYDFNSADFEEDDIDKQISYSDLLFRQLEEECPTEGKEEEEKDTFDVVNAVIDENEIEEDKNPYTFKNVDPEVEKDNRKLQSVVNHYEILNKSLIAAHAKELELLQQEIHNYKQALKEKTDEIDKLKSELQNVKLLSSNAMSNYHEAVAKHVEVAKNLQNTINTAKEQMKSIHQDKHTINELKKDKEMLESKLVVVEKERDENILNVKTNALDNVQLYQINQNLSEELSVTRNHCQSVENKGKESVNDSAAEDCINYVNSLFAKQYSVLMQIDRSRKCEKCHTPYAELFNHGLSSSCPFCQNFVNLIELKRKNKMLEDELDAKTSECRKSSFAKRSDSFVIYSVLVGVIAFLLFCLIQ